MNNAMKQHGMTTLGMVLVLCLIGFFTLITVRLAPAYLEFFSVSSVLDSMESESILARKTVPEIRMLIIKRFRVNSIKGVKARDIKIETSGKGLSVTANYEIRIPLMANVDAVTKFFKSIEIPKN